MKNQVMKMNDRGYNFSAGPATLPDSILLEAQESLLNWRSTGMSILEVPHRSKHFMDLLVETEMKLRSLLSIPDNYQVLFIGGPARTQFSMIPMNFISGTKSGGYVVSGLWSHKAWSESQRLKPTVCVASAESSKFQSVPIIDRTMIDDSLAYVFYTPNETVNGVQIRDIPDVGNIPLIADMTSFILSEPINVNQFDMIFAGAQKLVANAGLTIAIIRDSFVEQIKHHDLPFLLDYRTHIAERSLAATPPTFNCYLANLMFDWVKEQGGVSALHERNKIKSQLLYNMVDSSQLYHCAVKPEDRSVMNVCFHITKPELEDLFIERAAENGLLSLRGHRLAGGIRASLYNAMSIDGVKALVDFMTNFEKEHG